MNYLAQQIHELRKSGNLEKAYDYASFCFLNNKNDDDIKYAYVLIIVELFNKYIRKTYRFYAKQLYYNILDIKFSENSQYFSYYQKILKKVNQQIDIHYNDVKQADELSKYGKHKDALSIIRNLYNNNDLNEVHHENYGWILYRFLQKKSRFLANSEISSILDEYIKLKNDRPSQLHSNILRFAIYFSKINQDFDFYNFLILWNTKNLRYEDKTDKKIEGKINPSLLSRICRILFEKYTIKTLDEYSTILNTECNIILEIFRQNYFWKIYYFNEEENKEDLFKIIDNYSIEYPKYGQSYWNSRILDIALYSVYKIDKYKFLDFFYKWNSNNFRNEDWTFETLHNDHIRNHLATNVLNKCFEFLIIENNHDEISKLVNICFEIVSKNSQNQVIISEICSILVNNNIDINIDKFLSTFKFYRDISIDFFRQPFYSLLENSATNNNYKLLQELLTIYLNKYTNYGSSHWHSEILKFAYNKLSDNYLDFFLDFFEKWNIDYFQFEDWNNNNNNFGYKILNNLFNIIIGKKRYDLVSRIIKIYEYSIYNFCDDDNLNLNLGELYYINNQKVEAKNIFSKLAIYIPNNYKVWYCLSMCYDENIDLKIGFLIKAISVANNNNLSKIHLSLAKYLITKKLFSYALFELNNLYSIKQDANSDYYNLLEQCSNSTPEDIKNISKQYLSIVYETLYSKVYWKNFTFIKKYKGLYYFYNKEQECLKIKPNDLLLNIEIGTDVILQSYKDNLLNIKTLGNYKWSNLPINIGVVVNKNTEKSEIEIIDTKSRKFIYKYQENEYFDTDTLVKFLYYKSKINTIVKIKNIKISEGITEFPKCYGFVDNILVSTEQLHFKFNSLNIGGTISANDNYMNLKVGDIFEMYYIFLSKDTENQIIKILQIAKLENIDQELKEQILKDYEIEYMPEE
ncbi:MAG: hypothetical protein MJ211_01145 [Bacteroidales bacterium]|nr:hypothetical protein [Bacteroidales bacterium]